MQLHSSQHIAEPGEMIQHFRAVWTYRYFWMSLVKSDIMTRYRRSVLGIGWSLLQPLGMTAVFCLVFSKLAGSSWQMYAQETLAGMAVWDFMRNTTLQGCQALIRHEGYIRQCPLPYGIYPLRTMMANAVHFLIALVVLVAIVAIFQSSWHPITMLWAVIPAVLLTSIFLWATATIASFATVYFHDVSHLMELSAQAFFFLSPIIYNRQRMEDLGLGWISMVNPVVPFIEMVRMPLVYGTYPEWQLYAFGGGMTVIFVGLAFGTIAWLQKRVIFHM